MVGSLKDYLLVLSSLSLSMACLCIQCLQMCPTYSKDQINVCKAELILCLTFKQIRLRTAIKIEPSHLGVGPPFVRLPLVPPPRSMVAMALEGISNFSQACENLL